MLYYDYYYYNAERYFLLFDEESLLVLDNKLSFEDYKNNFKELRRINALNYKNILDSYFKKEGKYFNLKLAPQGTEFQKKVWQELQKIPYGETRTYSQIAEYIGAPRAVRAVATAIAKNPILVFIPCHRVISKSKKLGGYRGGLQLKEFLLNLEHR